MSGLCGLMAVSQPGQRRVGGTAVAHQGSSLLPSRCHPALTRFGGASREERSPPATDLTLHFEAGRGLEALKKGNLAVNIPVENVGEVLKFSDKGYEDCLHN